MNLHEYQAKELFTRYGVAVPAGHVAATAEEAEEVRGQAFDAYLGSNRTCEVGLNTATGKNYESFIYLLDELTR